MFKPGGFGGGANMQSLMRQAQKMQEDMQKNLAVAEEELENTTLTASAGGGMVQVEMTGKKKLLSVKIKPEAVDPDDVEMLEDLIMASVNEVIAKAEALEKDKKGGATGGLGGLF